MDDLAGGRLESWLRASIVSAFYNLVLGRGLGRRLLFMGTQAGKECESSWDPGQENKRAGIQPKQARPDVGWGVGGVRDVQDYGDEVWPAGARQDYSEG